MYTDVQNYWFSSRSKESAVHFDVVAVIINEREFCLLLSLVCCPLHALSFFAVIFQHYIIIIADTQYNTKMQKMSHIMNIYFITTPISALQTIIK